MAIAHAVRQGCDARNLYEQIVTWAEDMEVDGNLLDAARGAAESLPADYVHQQGWVLTAFRNAGFSNNSNFKELQLPRHFLRSSPFS